ncbi:hypothetical protein P689_122272 [Candidatus Riesia pediculischaeffi PTSU]|uniref:Uncharacterized protein n=1 Tax=Candidatus Riesia pediculischaeffi PTSU TaxID=1401651 RepID=A0A0C1VJ07_9ENTR|nr:hypothetical protein P689_122272 [Candidatus Riesia pediculischaeffi PTSU]
MFDPIFAKYCLECFLKIIYMKILTDNDCDEIFSILETS